MGNGMAITKYKGVPMAFADGVEYVIPALSLRQVQQLQGRLAAYTGGNDAESIELVIDTVHAAVTRNYPDMPRDTVQDGLDLRNMGDFMAAVMGASGMVEKVDTGEVQATA